MSVDQLHVTEVVLLFQLLGINRSDYSINDKVSLKK